MSSLARANALDLGALTAEGLAPTRDMARLYKSKRSDCSDLDLSGHGDDFSEERHKRAAYVGAGLALALLVLASSAPALAAPSPRLRGADARLSGARELRDDADALQGDAPSTPKQQLRGSPPKKSEHYLDLIHDHGDCDSKIWCGADVFTKPAELCSAVPSFPGAPELDDACETSRCTWSDGCKTYADFFCFNKIEVRKGTWREVCDAANKAVEAYSDAAARADTIAEAERLTGFADRIKHASETHCLADAEKMDAMLTKVLKAAVDYPLTAAPKLARLGTLSGPKPARA